MSESAGQFIMHESFKRLVVESADVRGSFSLVITVTWIFVTVANLQTDLQGRESVPRSRFGVVDVDVEPYVQFMGPYTAVVRWDMPETRDSILEYWTIESLAMRAKDSSETTAHEITLYDLEYRSRYYYRVGCTSGGTELFTDIYTFDNAINYTRLDCSNITSPYPVDSLSELYEQSCCF